MITNKKYLSEDDARYILRYHRCIKNFSRQTLANTIAIHPQLIYKFEVGSSGISVINFMKLIKILGYSIYIYDYSSENVYNSNGCNKYDDFCNAILYYRNKKKYSRRKLADISNVSEITINNFEKGLSVSLRTLLTIFKGLDLKIMFIDNTINV